MTRRAPASTLLAELFQIAFERDGSQDPDDIDQQIGAHAGESADRGATPIFEAHDRTAPICPRSFRWTIGTLRSCSATQRISVEFGARK